MRRGTTPAIKVRLKGIELSTLQSLYLTFEQGNIELTKNLDDVTIDASDNSLSVTLSQQETLGFNDGDVKVQIRAMTVDGDAIASNIKTVSLGHILKEGVIQ